MESGIRNPETESWKRKRKRKRNTESNINDRELEYSHCIVPTSSPGLFP